MSKYVIVNTPDTMQAESTANRLVSQGYPRDSITLIANHRAARSLDTAGVAVTEFEADESLWERFKNFFGTDETDAMSAYRQDIHNGNILVVVDDAQLSPDMKQQLIAMTIGHPDTAQTVQVPIPDTAAETQAQPQDEMDGVRDETIRLQEEQLHVDKEAVQTGEVTLKKRVVEETETVDVPVMHEELVIERTPVTGQQAGSDDFDDEAISIPLMEEQVHVTKEPVVTEEIHLHKRDVEDTKKVSASIRKEELDLQKDGSAIVENANPGQSPSAPL